MKQTCTLNESQLRTLISETVMEVMNEMDNPMARYNIVLEELQKYIAEDPSREYDLAVVMNNLKALGRFLQNKVC